MEGKGYAVAVFPMFRHRILGVSPNAPEGGCPSRNIMMSEYDSWPSLSDRTARRGMPAEKSSLLPVQNDSDQLESQACQLGQGERSSESSYMPVCSESLAPGQWVRVRGSDPGPGQAAGGYYLL